MKPLQIGIIRVESVENELRKEEVLKIHDAKRPWLKNTKREHVIKDTNGIECTSDDIAIATYIEAKYGKAVRVNIIDPHDPNIAWRIRENDLNFLLVYDILEAFHTMPAEKFNVIRKAMMSNNVFPFYSYQQFINYKNLYYEYLHKKGISVLPFCAIYKTEFDDDRRRAITKVLQMTRGDKGWIISKPLYGQEGVGFVIYEDPVSYEKIEVELERQLKHYEGVIFQPYVDALSTGIEYKCMFIGDTLRYITCIEANSEVVGIVTDFSEKPNIAAFAKKVFASLPAIAHNGIQYPKLVTRIDIGCCWNEQLFVSEVEFVPTLSMYNKKVDDLIPETDVGDRMVHIARMYKENKNLEYIQYAKIAAPIIVALMLAVYIAIHRKRYL